MKIWQQNCLLLVVAFFFAGAMSVSGLANLAVFFLFLISLFFMREGKSRESFVFFMVLALPLVLTLLQMVFGFNVSSKALDAPSRLMLAAVGIFSLVQIKSQRQLRAVVPVILSAVGVAIWAYLSTHVAAYSWQDGLRAWNGFSNPIPFGVLSLMFGFLVAILPHNFISSDLRVAVLVKLLCWGLSFYAVYMSQTRAALLIFPFLLLVLLVYYWPDTWRRKLLYVLPVIFVATTVVAGSDNKIKHRALEGVNDFAVFDKNINTSMGLRLEMWRVGLEIVKDHPLFGVGKAGYYDVVQEMVRKNKASIFIKGAPHPHNELLNMTVEMGAVGLISGLLLYFFPLQIFWRGMREKDSVVRFASAAGAIVVLTFLVAGTMDSYFWIVSQTSIYGFCVTVFYAMVLARKKEISLGDAPRGSI